VHEIAESLTQAYTHKTTDRPMRWCTVHTSLCRPAKGCPSLSQRIVGFGFPTAGHLKSTVRKAGVVSRRNSGTSPAHRGPYSTSESEKVRQLIYDYDHSPSQISPEKTLNYVMCCQWIDHTVLWN